MLPFLSKEMFPQFEDLQLGSRVASVQADCGHWEGFGGLWGGRGGLLGFYPARLTSVTLSQ